MIELNPFGEILKKRFFQVDRNGFLLKPMFYQDYIKKNNLISKQADITFNNYLRRNYAITNK